MLTKKINILYSISLSIFIVYSSYLYANYKYINEIVAIHYTLDGHADSFGSKVYLIYLNVGHLLLLIILLLGVMNPKYANYPYEITESNKVSSYKNMQYFLSIIAILSSLVCAYMTYIEIHNIHNSFLYLIGFVTFLPLTILIFKK